MVINSLTIACIKSTKDNKIRYLLYQKCRIITTKRGHDNIYYLMLTWLTIPIPP